MIYPQDLSEESSIVAPSQEDNLKVIEKVFKDEALLMKQRVKKELMISDEEYSYISKRIKVESTEEHPFIIQKKELILINETIKLKPVKKGYKEINNSSIKNYFGKKETTNSRRESEVKEKAVKMPSQTKINGAFYAKKKIKNVKKECGTQLPNTSRKRDAKKIEKNKVIDSFLFSSNNSNTKKSDIVQVKVVKQENSEEICLKVKRTIS